MKFWLITVVITVLLFLPAVAEADRFHYNNNLIGERAAAMGGAFTALGDEASGCYYNPAGLVDIDDDYVSLSMTIFQLHIADIMNYRGSKRLTRNAFNVIPASIGTIHSYGNHRFGFSVIVPSYDDSVIEFHDENTRPELHINSSNKSVEYLAGPSAGFYLNDKVSLGMSLYGYYRSDKEYLSVLMRRSDNFEQEINSSDRKLVGIMPLVGVLFKPSNLFQIGASVRTGLRVYGKATIYNTRTTNIIGQEPVSISKVDAGEETELPIGIRAGASLRLWPGNIISADLVFYDPVLYKSAGSQADLNPVLNVNVGVEQLLGNTWSLRAGFYTDFTAAPDIDISKPNPPPHIDLFGAALGVGFDGAFTTTTVGLNGAWGKGRAAQSGKIFDLREYYIGIYFGGSFRYHTEDEIDALRRWYDIDVEDNEKDEDFSRIRWGEEGAPEDFDESLEEMKEENRRKKSGYYDVE